MRNFLWFFLLGTIVIGLAPEPAISQSTSVVDFSTGGSVLLQVCAIALLGGLLLFVAVRWHRMLAREVGQRKRAEEALREGGAKYRTILDHVEAMYYELDLAGNFTGGTEVSEKILGVSTKEFIGRNFSEFCDEENARTLFETYGKVYETGKSATEVAWNVTTPAGIPVFVEASAALMRNADGEPIGFRGIARDVTERKKAAQALRESEETLSEITSSAPIAIVMLALDTSEISFWNEAAERIFGWKASEAIGGKLHEFIVPEHCRKQHLAGLKRFNQSGKGNLIGVSTEVSAVNKEGVEFPAELHLSTLTLNGRQHAIGLITDITERKKSEAQLQIALQAADDANRAKSEFLANMSHEIRTPMNAILGMTHLALQTELSLRQSDYLNKIKLSANNLLGIINDILDFSKIEAGKLNMESVEFNLDDVMNQLAPVITVKSQEKENLEVLFDVAQNVPRLIVGDPLRLGQVLINLANNAVKFTQEGEVVISVRVAQEETDRVTLEFLVKDTGIGLTRAQIDNLFEAFTQADASTTRKYGGTGLGLTISKHLVEMMGGEIRVETEPAQGSTFIFTSVFGKSGQRVQMTPKPSPGIKDLRVLVVDDNATSREILRDLLESFAFSVSLAASGEEGLSELEAVSGDHAYDLVFMDWKMPGMNGIEASRRIKKNPGLAKTPKIIMVTAYGREEIMRQADQTGLAGCLIKPLNASVLFDTIMQIFGKEATEAYQAAPRKALGTDTLKQIRGAHVLLVEDNEINQDVARELLERAGLPVTIAGNGKEALRALAEKDFEAVLMDVQMPIMDGYQASREIRRNDRLVDLPIIAMTAHAMAGDREKCQAAGMNDYVSKPIDPAKLFSTLVHWVRPGKRPIPSYLQAKIEKFAPTAEARPRPYMPGICVRTGLATLGGDWQLYQTLLRKFRRNHPHVAEEIKHALDGDDRETAIRLAHTIKGLAGNMGADGLHAAAADLEADLGQDTRASIEGRVEAFSRALHQVLDSIAAFEADAADAAGTQQTDHPGRKTVAPKQVRSRLNELREHLQEDDTRAVRSLESLRAVLPVGLAEDRLVELKKNIERYAFEEALKILTQVEQALEEVRGGNKYA